MDISPRIYNYICENIYLPISFFSIINGGCYNYIRFYFPYENANKIIYTIIPQKCKARER